MSKRDSIARYNIIIKKVRKYGATYQEIMNELDFESVIQDCDFRISKRTFQRDLEDIRVIYNIDIQYDYLSGMYGIIDNDQSELSQRILEAFDTFNALNISGRLSKNINFEPRKSKGTENLNGLLHAIENNLQVSFTHQKFSDIEPSKRNVNPYAIKEFGNRWYLMGVDLKDNLIKSFAFDRLSDLNISRTKFHRDRNFDVNEHYKHCFGIVSPNDKKPQKVELAFKPHQAKYIKSLPLHASQQIVYDNENETVFSLNIVLTEDFIMEILSHGNRVKVLKPHSLINQIKEHNKNSLAQYERSH